MTSSVLLAVAFGGALGAILRAELLRLWQGAFLEGRDRAHAFAPALATLTANTMGCLALGDWAGQPALDAGVWDDFYVAGLCGGLTTFSTLCADVFRLARGVSPGLAAAYLALTVGLGASGFWLAASAA